MTDSRNPALAALLLRVSLGTMFLAHALLKYFVFTLPGTAGPVRAVGQVVREDAISDGGPPRLGIEFLILRDGARDRIRSYVEAGEGK